MLNETFQARFGFKICLLSFFCFCLISGCAVSAKNDNDNTQPETRQNLPQETKSEQSDLTQNSSAKRRFEIKANSPAEAVRAFYANLREGRIREALITTNLRPAIEKMTDEELEDFRADFEALARNIPTDIQISGEIITADTASVTAKIPDDETGKPEDKVFKLRRENDSWLFLTADEKTEAEVKNQGKNYFYNLRIEIHHVEAQKMLERVAKAQSVYAMQNKGIFADLKTLIENGLLAQDIQTSESTGYNYKLVLTSVNKGYFATAEPAIYGKSGKFSFLLEAENAAKKPSLSGKDVKGATLKN